HLVLRDDRRPQVDVDAAHPAAVLDGDQVAEVRAQVVRGDDDPGAHGAHGGVRHRGLELDVRVVRLREAGHEPGAVDRPHEAAALRLERGLDRLALGGRRGRCALRLELPLAVLGGAQRLLARPRLLGPEALDLGGEGLAEVREARLDAPLLGDEVGLQRQLPLARRLELGDDRGQAGLRRRQLRLGRRQLGLGLPEGGLLLGQALAFHLQGVEERVELPDHVGVLLREQRDVVIPDPQLVEAAAAREREQGGRAALLVERYEELAHAGAHLAEPLLEARDAPLGLAPLRLEVGDLADDRLALPAPLGELGADAVALLDALLELRRRGAEGRLDLGELPAPLLLELLEALDVRLEPPALLGVEYDLRERVRAGEEQAGEEGPGDVTEGARDRARPAGRGSRPGHVRSRRNCERPMALPTKPTRTASAARAPAIEPSRAGSRTNGTNVNCSERRAMPNW